MNSRKSELDAFDQETIDSGLKGVDPDQRRRVAAFLDDSARYLGVAVGGPPPSSGPGHTRTVLPVESPELIPAP